MLELEPLLLQGGGPSRSLGGAIFVFVVNLLIGAVGIHTGARLIIDRDVGYGRAVFTAFVGALVWAVVAFFLGWIPLLGPILALAAWIGVINWQYPGGWLAAATIGGVAWLVAALVLYALAALGLFRFAAFGIPGV
ncbi:hypothetical protein SAMN04487947_0010 [Halogeometricum rufum]|uniref:Yip1 domain-containing protein n=1 Tax=Halogeometricum rufum TaxID=553469 RepID=A0A1I6FU57_9EURY|nr:MULTISPECIES: hypothetical protein [Halogeometricum]MUV59040.1 hypothetical protein [Halogeometricum sp. CBA1124]SFR33479.1 hypothetical protein SAMN04487947_0010 [Halogeometricum rufum]